MIKHIVHHSRSVWKRGAFSFLVLAVIMLLGTAGLHGIETIAWLEAFYFMSMIATGQGPTFTPETPFGLVFVSLMAFISVGTSLAALGYIFGPFFSQLWRVGAEKFEEEIHRLNKKKS